MKKDADFQQIHHFPIKKCELPIQKCEFPIKKRDFPKTPKKNTKFL
jgi:hypothetical protein